MKLYSAPGTCATAMHIVLEWICKPYEVEQLDFKGMKSASYLKINPSGVVPTLVNDDNVVMTEGGAILQYLVDSNPQANIGPQLGDENRQELYRWIIYLSGTLHPYFWPHFMPMRFTVDAGGYENVQAASHILVDKAFTIINTHLEGRDWLVGSKKTVADAFLYAMAHWGYGLDKPMTDYKNIHSLMLRLSADPAVQKVHAQIGTKAYAPLAK